MINNDELIEYADLYALGKKFEEEKLGQKANVSAAMIGYIEKGLKPLPLKTGYLIAKALDCTVDELIEKECQIIAEK